MKKAKWLSASILALALLGLCPTSASAQRYFINETGGALADGSDGIGFVVNPTNGRFQTRRRGAVNFHAQYPGDAQLGNSSGNLAALFNLRVGSLNFGWQATAFSNVVVSNSVGTPAAGPSGSGTAADPWRLIIDRDASQGGRLYHQRITVSYVLSQNFLRVAQVVTIPAGNTERVRTYFTCDAMTKGQDTGTMMYAPNPLPPGTAPSAIGALGANGTLGNGFGGLRNMIPAPTAWQTSGLSGSYIWATSDAWPQNAVVSTEDAGYAAGWDLGTTPGIFPVQYDIFFDDESAPPAGCDSDAQCSGGTPFCQISTRACVACLTAASCNDSIECTVDTCNAVGECENPLAAAGAACTGGVCAGTNAMCVQCIENAHCNDNIECTEDICTNNICGNAAVPLDTTCSNGFCNGLGMCVECNANTQCADGNACTVDTCASNACAHGGVAAGTVGECAGGNVCSGENAIPANTCVACASSAQCSASTPVCDTQIFACDACGSDFGGTQLPCPEAQPFCNLSGALIGQCGRCTSNVDCLDHPAGGICNLVGGNCGTICAVDSDCAAGSWCPASGVCTAKAANGEAVSMEAPANSTCTTEIGSRLCVSSLCETIDNLCGLLNSSECSQDEQCRSTICDLGRCGRDLGGACTMPRDCRSNLCGATSTCVECDASTPCSNGRVCNGAGLCETLADAGVDGGWPDSGLPDAGVDSGRTDSGMSQNDAHVDATFGDASIPLPSVSTGCGCSVASEDKSSTTFWSLGFLALVWTYRRRRKS